MSTSGTGHQHTDSGSYDSLFSKPSLEHSFSRPSSRSSLYSTRAASPLVSFDDPVALRNQMSTLKHTIRHQQAQLNTLETIVRSGSRPYPPELAEEMSLSTSPPGVPPSSFPSTPKAKRRTSYEILQSIAGPDSGLPLPRRDSFLEDSSIREGIPADYRTSPSHQKRSASPNRSISRIPVSAVGNARALADDLSSVSTLRLGPAMSSISSPTRSPAPVPIDTENVSSSSNSNSGLGPPTSPNPRRQSLAPGGTTRVLADLQTGVINARNALENTRAQLRLSQRTVASLTRKVETLEDSRERVRLEGEGLNQVITRKERQNQELLERARKAEAEAAALKSDYKSETSTSKRRIRELESQLTESSTLSKKSENEYIVLRESIKGLVDGFKYDINRLKDEMRKREEKLKGEVDGVGAKYKKLLEEQRKVQKEREDLKRLLEEDRGLREKVDKRWMEEIEKLKEEVEVSGRKTVEAGSTAQALTGELTRLKRLIQNAGKASSSNPDSDEPPAPS